MTIHDIILFKMVREHIYGGDCIVLTDYSGRNPQLPGHEFHCCHGRIDMVFKEFGNYIKEYLKVVLV